MSTTVRFDALPAAVRTLLFQLEKLPGRARIDSQHPEIARNGADFPLSGLLIPGLIFGPVLTLGLWIYAGGPLMAARYAPVLLTLVSLWFFAGLAMIAVMELTGRYETVGDGDYLYAGTVLRIAGSMVTVFELAPATQAKYERQTYEHNETVYRGGNRYRKKSIKTLHHLTITAIATDGTQFVFRRSAEKNGAELERLANERFTRWHQARARNDHATMSALDPFAQCYAQRTLETREPQGPHRVLTPTPVKIALFVAVTALGLMPALYNLLLVE